jgi:transposase-like protein
LEKERKYNRGYREPEVLGIWYGGTGHQKQERRDRETLLPIIKAHVNEGSTIYSDQWAAYFTLKDECYTHLTVNHREEFMSSEGCCTNGIEGRWELAKLRIKKMKGVLPCRLPTYLDEFMYHYRFGHSKGDVFFQLIEDVSKFSTA